MFQIKTFYFKHFIHITKIKNFINLCFITLLENILFISKQYIETKTMKHLALLKQHYKIFYFCYMIKKKN